MVFGRISKWTKISHFILHFYIFNVPPNRENMQHMQQDLAQMLKTCLEKRPSSMRKRKTLSTRQKKLGAEIEMECTEQPEYLHLATDDSTFL